MHDVARAPDLPTAYGVVPLEVCLAYGLSKKRLHWYVASGRWQSPFPRVYVVFSGPLPRETLLAAALAYAGEDAVLSHDTAGACWGLCAWPDVIHITVPYHRKVEPQPGLRIHRSRTLTADDVHPTRSPALTRVERTVLDMLRSRRRVRDAVALAADAVRTRRTTAARLRAALLARPRTRWRRELLFVLPDIAAGAHSVLEVEDARLRRLHGLPEGRRQVRRLRDGAEYLDHVVGEYATHVEYDGRLGHDDAAARWRDMDRDNASEVAGMRHLRYGAVDLLERPCQVMIQQALVLRQQGWPGPFHRCSRCPRTLPAGL